MEAIGMLPEPDPHGSCGSFPCASSKNLANLVLQLFEAERFLDQAEASLLYQFSGFAIDTVSLGEQNTHGGVRFFQCPENLRPLISGIMRSRIAKSIRSSYGVKSRIVDWP
jgi:hypothetical protein